MPNPVRVRVLVCALAVALVALAAVAVGRSGPVEVPAAGVPVDPFGHLRTVEVTPERDAGKAGAVHSVLAYKYFTPGGDGQPSPDQLHFLFSAPARIHHVRVSADITHQNATLVEFMAGTNLAGYGEQDDADTFLHASWAGQEMGSIDEWVDLPPGVEVASGDFVGVGAWIAGPGPSMVSVEVVVVYEWL